ncbi:MAG: hypothetical protein EOP34_01650 [Rickettsiales bacterium]|nr:MAG: hypothetical protein EOP34_01650 [Rickettsiales bacterium]
MTNSDDTTAIDISEMIRMFGNQTIEQQNNTERISIDHDIATQNFHIIKRIRDSETDVREE